MDKPEFQRIRVFFKISPVARQISLFLQGKISLGRCENIFSQRPFGGSFYEFTDAALCP
jgi:hypothetical protein